MAWYTILFITVFSFFVVKLILSFIVGNIDFDVDLDGDIDADGSSVFSFKGILHFLMGFSAYLFGKSFSTTATVINGYVQFTLFDYIIAVLSGILLMGILYFSYKIATKANCTPKCPKELINNSTGKIYLNLGNGVYSVETYTPAGTINIDAFCDKDDLPLGKEIRLIVQNNKYIIEYDS